MILEGLLAYLVAEGIARKSSQSGPLPLLMLDPKDGVPAPTSFTPAASMVLGAFVVNTVPARPRFSELRTDIVEIKIRAAASTAARETEQALRSALTDKADWTMGGVHIVQSLEWRGLRRDGSSASDGYSYSVVYSFERRAA
jgi:hypothetical protein